MKYLRELSLSIAAGAVKLVTIKKWIFINLQLQRALFGILTSANQWINEGRIRRVRKGIYAVALGKPQTIVVWPCHSMYPRASQIPLV